MNLLRIIAAGIGEQTQQAVDNAGTDATASGAIAVILNSVYIIIGIVAVIFIILGGVGYATSQGDTNKLTKAKNTVIYSVVGLIIAIAAFAITNYILNQFK